VKCFRREQGLEIESWLGFLIDTDSLKMEFDILSAESNCLSYSRKLLKTDILTKIRLTAHFFAELRIVRAEPNCHIVERNGGGK
jgi:hypothetical protein